MGRSVLTICCNIVQVSFIVGGLYFCGFIHVHSPVFSWKIVCISPFLGVVLFVFFNSADTEYWSNSFVKWACREEETGLPLPEPKRGEKLSSMTNICRHPFSASYLIWDQRQGNGLADSCRPAFPTRRENKTLTLWELEVCEVRLRYSILAVPRMHSSGQRPLMLCLESPDTPITTGTNCVSRVVSVWQPGLRVLVYSSVNQAWVLWLSPPINI